MGFREYSDLLPEDQREKMTSAFEKSKNHPAVAVADQFEAAVLQLRKAVEDAEALKRAIPLVVMCYLGDQLDFFSRNAEQAARRARSVHRRVEASILTTTQGAVSHDGPSSDPQESLQDILRRIKESVEEQQSRGFSQ